MKLFIDTTDNRKIIVRLDTKELIKTYAAPRSQELLTVIDELLKHEGKTIKDITEIKTNPGPGAFTSLRVGVAVANALSFALHIPLDGQKPGKPIEPHYGKPPNISQHKGKFTPGVESKLKNQNKNSTPGV